MFYIWHRTECLQEAGAGTGSSFQRNGGVPGRRREAAAEGIHTAFTPQLRHQFFVPSESHYGCQLGNHISETPLAFCTGSWGEALYSENLLYFHHTDDKVSEENHGSSAQWHFHWMALSWDQGSAAVSRGQHLPVSRGQSYWLLCGVWHHPLPCQPQICKYKGSSLSLRKWAINLMWVYLDIQPVEEFIINLLALKDVLLSQDKRRRYSMMRSVESASSVFYHSQEEDPTKTGIDSQGSYSHALSGPLYDSYHDSMTDSGPATREYDASGNST